MIERLIADTHWSKVNTAYAVGRGDTAMAFVKDPIGNWNLKSYKSDPSKLLNAYTSFGVDILKTTAKLAGTGGASQIFDGLRASNAVTFGTSGPSNGTLSVSGLEENLIKQIESLPAVYTEQKVRWKKELETHRQGPLLETTTAYQNAEKQYKTDKDKFEQSKLILETTDCTSSYNEDKCSDLQLKMGQAELIMNRSKLEKDKSKPAYMEAVNKERKLNQNLSDLPNKLRENIETLLNNHQNLINALKANAVQQSRKVN